MAIQEKKIPKPSDIKLSPTSFSELELKELKDLKMSLNTLTFQLGQIFVEKIRIDEQENIFKNQLKDLEKKEASIAKKLTSKYGKGSIDIETGTFTPS
tara:strand:+ start:1792 stop:2085 length:294 start_codon:yes stop_codon:yes gene_type:complete